MTRAGFWQRRRAAAAAQGVPPPPLFPPRPVPPPPPKGPGLPDWTEILSAPPPVRDPPAVATPLAATPLVATPDRPAMRPPAEAERESLARVASLLAAGQIARAAAALDEGLRARPEVCDALGRPLYLLESLHIALLLGAEDAAADRARRLRPRLAPDDPVIEVLYARAAAAAGNRPAARANWRAALARRADLPEARDWLALHRPSPAGGALASALLGAGGMPAGVLAPPPLGPPPARPPELPDWLPARLLADVALWVDADGAPQIRARGGAAAAPASDDLALLFRHPLGLAGPAAFAELLLAAFSAQRHLLGHLRPVRLYVGRQGWAVPPEPGQTPAALAIQAEMLAALHPELRVIGEHDGEIVEANLLVVDGAARNAATDTLIGGMMPWVTQWASDARARAHAACGLPGAAEPPRAPGRRPRVLYVTAPPPRALVPRARERLFALFAAAGYEVAVVDPSVTPWLRQVRLAYGADIVTGAHGPALDLALWAHPRTRVLEFFPRGTRRYDGLLLAEAAGLGYLGVEGVAENGFVIQPRERWGPPVGVGEALTRDLPWRLLERAFPPRPPAS